MPKSSPGHFSGSADAFYDPDFTAQISSKMQVPDKISVIEGASESKGISMPFPEDEKTFMHVPERIIVAGGDEHIAAREPPPELRLESAISTEPPRNVLTTPPRVLTLSEYSYPGIELETKANKEPQNPTNISNGIAEMNEPAVSIYRAPEDEMAVLRTHIKLLQKRVGNLETENQMRQQREIILYSVGVIYFLFKGLKWLHKHL